MVIQKMALAVAKLLLNRWVGETKLMRFRAFGLQCFPSKVVKHGGDTVGLVITVGHVLWYWLFSRMLNFAQCRLKTNSRGLKFAHPGLARPERW